MYDIIVIGAGPAGMTAAIYGRRADKSVLVIEKETFGGQVTLSPKIENYPGFTQMSGNEFAELLVEQVMNLGADIELCEVKQITKADNGIFAVATDDGDFLGRSVIIASGARHRPLGVEREEDFVGHGLSYCAVCDGAFFKGKTVAVIGGGNSALVESVMLSELCEKVYIVQNIGYLTGESRLISKLQKTENVEIIVNTTVEELIGGENLEGIIMCDKDGNKSRLILDGIFVAVGQMPINGAFSNLVDIDERGYISSDEDCLTSTPGVFTAGDCRTKKVRQITTACADGAVAAVAACRYLEG